MKNVKNILKNKSYWIIVLLFTCLLLLCRITNEELFAFGTLVGISITILTVLGILFILSITLPKFYEYVLERFNFF